MAVSLEGRDSCHRIYLRANDSAPNRTRGINTLRLAVAPIKSEESFLFYRSRYLHSSCRGCQPSGTCAQRCQTQPEKESKPEEHGQRPFVAFANTKSTCILYFSNAVVVLITLTNILSKELRFFKKINDIFGLFSDKKENGEIFKIKFICGSV